MSERGPARPAGPRGNLRDLGMAERSEIAPLEVSGATKISKILRFWRVLWGEIFLLKVAKYAICRGYPTDLIFCKKYL